jgi:hypothetical protein
MKTKKTVSSKTQQKSNLISIFDKRPKDKRLYDSYKEVNAWREIPLQPAMINKLEMAILDWCQLPDSRSFEQFLDERGIHDSTWDKWMNSSPVLKEAHDFALRHIGVVRENGMADRKYESRVYAFTQRNYSKVWRATQDLEYARKKALAQEQEPNRTYVVYADVAEDCPEVKSLKKPDTQIADMPHDDLTEDTSLILENILEEPARLMEDD